MKSIFHGGETLVRLTLFTTLGLAIFSGVFTYLSAHGHEIGSSNMSLREHIEFDPETPPSDKKYHRSSKRAGIDESVRCGLQ